MVVGKFVSTKISMKCELLNQPLMPWHKNRMQLCLHVLPGGGFARSDNMPSADFLQFWEHIFVHFGTPLGKS